jgi:hypothetical protein
MLITKTSILTGITHTLEIPLTKSEYAQGQIARHNAFIQDVFPQLDDDQREFLISGCTKEEWDTKFNDNDDEI